MFDSTGFILQEGESITFSPSTSTQQLVSVSLQLTNESETDSAKVYIHLLNPTGDRISTPFKQPLEPEETVSISDKIFLSKGKSLKFESRVGSLSVTISHFNSEEA